VAGTGGCGKVAAGIGILCARRGRRAGSAHRTYLRRQTHRICGAAQDNIIIITLGIKRTSRKSVHVMGRAGKACLVHSALCSRQTCAGLRLLRDMDNSMGSGGVWRTYGRTRGERHAHRWHRVVTNAPLSLRVDSLTARSRRIYTHCARIGRLRVARQQGGNGVAASRKRRRRKMAGRSSKANQRKISAPHGHRSAVRRIADGGGADRGMCSKRRASRGL